jgi:hypothetical protein
MLRDSLPETEKTAGGAEVRTLVDPSGLARFMETALKTLKKTKSSKRSVEIDREDLERVNCRDHLNAPSLVEMALQ